MEAVINKAERSDSPPAWNKMRYRTDRLMHWLFVGSSIFVSLIIFSIIIFVGQQGVRTFADVSITEFFFSTDWAPNQGKYGALLFILGSFMATGLALVISVPFAVSGAVFMSKIAPTWMREILRPATDLFVGIP